MLNFLHGWLTKVEDGELRRMHMSKPNIQYMGIIPGCIVMG